MGAADKLYNGNIAETFWRTATDGGYVRNYGYKYDSLNRLKDATYQKSNSVTHNYDENLTYDKNGNIVTLLRYTHNSDGQIGAMKMDELTYDYKSPTSNQLMKVTEGPNGNVSQGFIDGNTTGDDYVYDANGNMTVDKNKGITAITYNHLNLPTKIVFGTTGSISYVYSGSGQKVQKVVTENTTVTTTDYLGGYQYKNTVLQFFPTVEGYVKNTPVSGTNTYNYVFNYTDHLGNVRLSYTKNPSTNALTILEENNYYPFGLKHNSYNVDNFQPGYKYKYNGKELQDELGLNMYDYGWRNYMPDIGRWTQIDPLFNDLKFAHDNLDVDPDDQEEVYMAIVNDLEIGGGIYNTDNLNPYGYGYNNPVSFDDPDGRCPSCIWGAVIGAAVEYGGQVAANLYEGKSLKDSMTDIDVGDVLVSAGEGALTGGISAIRSVAAKAAVTVGSEIIKNTLDVKVKGGKPSVKVNDAKSVARNTIIGLSVNGVGKAIPSTKVKVKSEITPKQAVRTARVAGHVTTGKNGQIDHHFPV